MKVETNIKIGDKMSFHSNVYKEVIKGTVINIYQRQDINNVLTLEIIRDDGKKGWDKGFDTIQSVYNIKAFHIKTNKPLIMVYSSIKEARRFNPFCKNFTVIGVNNEQVMEVKKQWKKTKQQLSLKAFQTKV